MNLFVADPEWGWWIVFYFFLGGIAAGAYFLATLIDLVGREKDRDLARAGYWLAFPLVSVCGVLLILDLNRPERFWHMLFRSEVVHAALDHGWPFSAVGWRTLTDAPMLKYWSPMSVGSWALLLFGFCSSLSFVGSLWKEGRLARWLRQCWFGRLVQIVGCGVGFFVAAYTGALLTATNQPIWSDSVWIAPLFLASAASTGLTAMLLVARWRSLADLDTTHRMERADLFVLGLELALFAVFLASLGALLVPVLNTTHGKVLIAGTLVVGLLIPMFIHLRVGISGPRSAWIAAGFVLVGGFLLRFGILYTPPELLADHQATSAHFGPEDGRSRGGGPGADSGNRSRDVKPRTKAAE